MEISWALGISVTLGTANIYVIGRIIFDDVFENTWVRDFVWEYNREIKGWIQMMGRTRKGVHPKQDNA
jgi:hypothetical protein